MTPDKKRILIALYYYQPYVSGVSVYAKRVAEGLAASGHEVTVLTSRHDSALPKEEKIHGVRVVRRPVLLKFGKGVVMPTFWLDIIRFARSHDFVNPHLPLAESGISSLFIPKRKIITTYQCDIYLGDGALNRLISLISIKLMSLQLMRSKVVVPLAEDYFEHSKMKKYAYKSHPVNPPISALTYKRIPSGALFDRLNIAGTDKKIGFVGRIVYEKGIDYLLESIPHLKKRYKDFKIIIVGEYEKVAGGSIKEKLDIYLNSYPEHIIFTGFLSDNEIVQFYSGIDVLVLPSIDPLEAFGMVQVEAMLCGAPVVASNMPGVRRAVQMTGFGRISNRKDPKDIARQIIEVLSHPKRYRPQRQKLIELFDPWRAVSEYERLMADGTD